uniref:Ribosomal protein L33 n=1 Tax=Spumella elongata TaxID=89044 RepID=A0A7S3HT58_9STRA
MSPVLLRNKSKRLAVKLVSSVQTGFRYWTHKSPLKRDTRVALLKYDPIVNRHVMFYETPISKPARKPRRPRPMAWFRWTGKNIQDLVKDVGRRHEQRGTF